MADKRNVYVVDDAAEIRRLTFRMLGAAGLSPRVFAYGQDYLDAMGELEPGCVLLDLKLPDIDGMEILRRAQPHVGKFQFIVITGRADVETAVEVMRMGAADFIRKPFSENAIFETLERGFARLEAEVAAHDQREGARHAIAGLTNRERDVLVGLLSGLANKGVGLWLGLSPRTVEMHRAHMMEKLGARTLSDALRIAMAGGLRPAEASYLPEGDGSVQ